MKRNLSSQAIKAMAIGMAVTMGSSTAISGVVRGTVVNAYAATGTHAMNINEMESTITNDGDNVTIVIKASGNAKFQSGNASTNKTLGFTVKKAADTAEAAGTTVFTGANDKGTLNITNENTITLTIPRDEFTTGAKFDGTEKFTVSYEQNGDSDVQIDTTGEESFSGANLSVTDIALKGSIDKVAPTFESASAAYTEENSKGVVTVTLKDGEKLAAKTLQGAGGFEIKKGTTNNANDEGVNVEKVEIVNESKDIKLTLSGKLTNNQQYNVVHTKGMEIKDLAGNILVGTTGNDLTFTATSEPVDKAPAIERESATYSMVDGQHYVKFTTDVDLDVVSKQSGNGGFTITGSGEDATVTKYEVKNSNKKEVILTLSGPIKGTEPKLAFDNTSNEYLKNSTDKLAGFSNEPISITPVNEEVKIASATYDEKAKTITLKSADKKVALTKKEITQSADKVGFTIKAKNTSTKVPAISKIEVKDPTDLNNNEIVITLAGKLAEDDYTISYKPQTPPAIEKLAEITNLEVKVIMADKPVENTIEATVTGVGTYTFEVIPNTTDKVQLVGFEGESNSRGVVSAIKFKEGIITADKKYTLTKIGNGKDALTNITTEALKGHTANVTEIAASAFKGNVNVTDLSFPNVTKVGVSAFEDNVNVTTLSFPKVEIVSNNAFKGASNLTKIDLGSKTIPAVTIGSNVFDNKVKNLTITTNQNTVEAIKMKVPNATVIGVKPENRNDSKASIREGAHYQTTKGLRFVGLSDNTLAFTGTKKYQEPTNGKFDGTEKNPYEVLYNESEASVIVIPGENVGEITHITKNGYELAFSLTGKEATLIGARKIETRTKTDDDKLKGGILKFNNENYTFTTIGNSKDSLPTDFNATTVLGEENLVNIDKIDNYAFKGNTATTELNLPKIGYIGANAFNGAENLKVNLGSNKVMVGADAFKGTTNVTVKSDNQQTIDNLLNSGLTAGNVGTLKGEKFVTSAVVENTKPKEIKLTLNAPLEKPIDESTGFYVTVNGKEVEDIRVVGGDSKVSNIITITLNNPIEVGQKVVVYYDGTNLNAKDLLTFDDKDYKVVDNKVQGVNAQVTGATVDGTTLTVKTKTSLLSKSTQLTNKEEFNVTKGSENTKVTVDSVVVKSNEIVLTLAGDGIVAGDTEVKFAYTGGNAELRSNDNKPINPIGEMLVVNKKDNTAPQIKMMGASYAPSTPSTGMNKYTITLPVSEPVRVKDNMEPLGFVVTKSTGNGQKNANNTGITVDSVKIGDDEKSILINITANVTLNDTFNVTVNEMSNVVDYGFNSATENSNQLTGTVEGIGKNTPSVKGYVEYATNQEKTKGYVTTIDITEGNEATQETIQSMLTDKLIYIKSLKLKGNIELDFDKVNLARLRIASNAITGGTLNIKLSSHYDAVFLAGKLLDAGVSNVTINEKYPDKLVNNNNNNNSRPPYDNNNGSSSSGSSSGSSGGGAVIGTVTDNKTENNNNNNSSNSGSNNNQVSENKQLNFDVIKLPSINGEPKMFGDVPASHWAKTYIDKLSTAGVINGANGNFMPNGKTKRADVTIMLVNLLGLTPEANSKFADVNPSAYYAPYVGTASSYGIVNGSNGIFNPEGIISRQDTMVMIAQILKGLSLNVNTDASSLGQFSDLGSVSGYAQESVAILVNSGIISGNNGKLNPKAPVTRAEMATIMSKLYDVLAAAK